EQTSESGPVRQALAWVPVGRPGWRPAHPRALFCSARALTRGDGRRAGGRQDDRLSRRAAAPRPGADVTAETSARQRLKQAARRSVALASWASGSLLARERLGAAPRIRALTYHRFGDAPGDPWCVATAEFAAQ